MSYYMELNDLKRSVEGGNSTLNEIEDGISRLARLLESIKTELRNMNSLLREK